MTRTIYLSSLLLLCCIALAQANQSHYFTDLPTQSLALNIKKQLPVKRFRLVAFNLTDISEFVKLDMTPQGFHAMILRPGKNPVFIDPINKNNNQYYLVYNKKNYKPAQRLKCGVQGNNQSLTTYSPKHDELLVFFY